MAHLLPGARQSAPPKASKGFPAMKAGPWLSRSPQQTLAWPRAWEGAGLISRRLRLKVPPRERDPGLIPSCPRPLLPIPLQKTGEGRGDQRSSLSLCQALYGSPLDTLPTSLYHSVLPNRTGSARLSHLPEVTQLLATWQSQDLCSGLDLNSIIWGAVVC